MTASARLALPISALAAALCFSAPATADTPANATKLPEARTLVDRHIAALGGEAALQKNVQATIHGKFAMPAANLEAPMTVWVDGIQRMATHVELPGLGNIQGGIQGDLVWSMDPFQGPRILSGSERSQQIEMIAPDAIRRLPSFVSKMQTESVAEYDGKRCYKVNVEWHSGHSSWDCYGVDDGLLLASGGKQNSPMGEIETVSIIKRYDTINGETMPVLTEVSMMGQKQLVSIDKIDLGAPDAARFELPAAIKALAEQASNSGN